MPEALLIFVFSYILLYFLILKLSKIKPFGSDDKPKEKKTRIFLLITLLTFLIMLVWYIAYLPGLFSGDSINQYEQAISGKYNDWHPVWQTLISFTLPLKLTGSVLSIVFFQIIYFSLIIGYTELTIYELCGIKVTIITWLLIILNPYVGYINLYSWKDVAFAFGGLLSLVITIRLIVFKKNDIKLWKVVLFGILLASTTIFRHNAILYTVPLLIVLIINTNKKIWSIVLIATLVSFFVIKIPIYKVLNVEDPDKRVVETMGLPMVIIGNVANEKPELMDDELAEFVYSIASPEDWYTEYVLGNFNNIKWYHANLEPIEEQGTLGVLKMMFKSFKASPKHAFKAFFAATDIVYGFDTGLEGNFNNSFAEHTFDAQYSNAYSDYLKNILEGYANFVNNSIFVYFRTYGINLLVLLISAISMFSLKTWNSWKKALLIVPIFIYDFGTMLFLTGPDSRFFYITFLVTPVLICYILHEKDGCEYGK